MLKIVLKHRVWLIFLSLFFLSATLYTLHVIKAKSILWGDSRYYYAITRSLTIRKNLNFEDVAFLPNVGFPNPPIFSPATNRVINKFSPGAPLLWIPAFVIGQGASNLQIASTHRLPVAIGYSWLTQWLVGLETVGFSVLGLFVVLVALSPHFGQKIALLTSAILFLTTQLFFYTCVDSLNSHSASFLLSAFLFLAATRWVFVKKPTTLGQSIVLGLLAGWLALIRNQDIIFCVPIGLTILLKNLNLPTILQKNSSKISLKKSFQNSVHAMTFAVSAMLPLLIQLKFTYYLYGQFNSPYVIGGEGLHWSHPDFGRVLLSSGNGFLFFAPIVFFLLWGLLKAAHRANPHPEQVAIARAGLVIFVLATYVIASWGAEILGGPYGSRMFTSTLPWLAYGGTVMLQKYWSDKKSRLVILLLIFVCFLNNIGQTGLMLIRH